MVATLDHGLRGLRDRAILLIGFAGGLRRSEITGLDCGPDHTEDGAGWIEFLDQDILIRVRGKTGWREVEIGRGSSEHTCPVVALETWLKLGRIAHGPLFRRITGGGKEAGADRLTDRHVARLVKRTALAAGVRGDLSEAERRQKFSGHSLRAGLATAARAEPFPSTTSSARAATAATVHAFVTFRGLTYAHKCALAYRHNCVPAYEHKRAANAHASQHNRKLMPVHNDAPMLWRRYAMAYSTIRFADGAATDVDPLAHLRIGVQAVIAPRRCRSPTARAGRLVRKGGDSRHQSVAVKRSRRISARHIGIIVRWNMSISAPRTEA
jgi:hypothetical protein